MSSLSWAKQWQESFNNIDDLLAYLELSRAQVPVLSGEIDFAFKVPRPFAERMRKGDPCDPLLLQVLPLSRELDSVTGFTVDPLQEKSVNPVPGLLHKYKSRVLITLTSACAVNCRYCFRRHFPYKENNPGTKGWELIFDYLHQHPDIIEVILSGGDPLSASDDVLHKFIQRLENISSIKYLRFHTRVPLVIPDRITPALLSMVKNTRFKVTMVLHSNHANEWDNTLLLPMQQLRAANVNLLNQSVLLKNVNDSADALIGLSYRLYDIGVMPYYLHVLDRVAGAAHFDVCEQTAVELMRQVIYSLPGYLVPKLVREMPQEKSKTPIDLLLA